MIKSLFVSMVILLGQISFANQGDDCVEVYSKYGYSSGDGDTIGWCNKNGYTAAHAKAVDFFLKIGVNNMNINELFNWAKQNEFTKAHVDCAIIYTELGATNMSPAELMLYCKRQAYTAKQLSCARNQNPKSVQALNNVFVNSCHK